MSDVTFDMSANSMEIHQRKAEPWKVTVVDTGENTMTGGRVKRIQDYIDDTFCLTYGDGLADLDINELIKFHRNGRKEATVTCVQPAARFGSIEFEGSNIRKFLEKPVGDGRWISGGFFVLEPSVFDRIDGDDTIWEREPMEGLANEGQLSGYKHTGFWSAMDTLRDRERLESHWSVGDAPWKVWG